MQAAGAAAEGCTRLERGLHGAGMGDGISAVPLLGWEMNSCCSEGGKGDGEGRRSPVIPVGWLGSGGWSQDPGMLGRTLLSPPM